MPLNPQNPHFSTPFRPLWCQSVKVKVSNCISAYVDMRHFIWLIIIYNILYIIIILYILLFIIISITFTCNFQLNNPSFKETVKSHPSLIKCQSEFDTLTLTLWHLILFYPYQYHDFNISQKKYPKSFVVSKNLCTFAIK